MEVAITLAGAGGSALLVLLGQAVVWGRIRQTIEHQEKTSQETLVLVREMRHEQIEAGQRTAALEATAEDVSARLDRLEAPLFQRRH